MKRGELLPGLYAEVRFQVQREKPPIITPSRALIIQTSGPQIATVDAQNKVALRSVIIGSGRETNARYILNPTDTIREGMTVDVEAPELPKVASK